MANKMLIDATHPEETRVVVVRGNRVEEFDFESASRKQLRGNIYLAKVTRVEPSLQAAFVDYGGNRHGFLAFSEIHPDYYQIPVADRQALIEEEERAHRDAEAEADRRAGGGRRRQRAAEQPRDAVHTEPVEGDAHDGEAHDGEAHEADVIEGEHAAHDGDITAIETEAEPMPTAAQPTAPGAEVAAEGTASRRTDDDAHHDEAHHDEAHAPAFGAQPATPAEAGSAPPEVAYDTEPQDGAPHDTAAHEEEHGAADRGADASPETGASDDGGVADVEEEEVVESVGGADAMEEVPDRMPRLRRQYKIQEVIKRRQIMLVQVVKEERGTKGAALTTYLSLAGRYSVLMPNTARGGGISRKITNIQDRKRLKEVAQELDVPEGMGVILRTAGASRTKTEIKRDFEYLLRMWETVRDVTLNSTAPTLVYEEGSLVKRAIRDLYNKDIDEVIVAGEGAYKEAKDFMRMLMPSHAKNVKPYHDSQPILTRYGIESQLDAMFSPVVQLRSGGYIVMNQAEALVAIDVNSGRATREHHIEDTALKTNLEAAEEIARQLRLRDLAGLIVIDFIDMDEKRNNRAVERRLKECLKHDRARIQVGRISHFGLLEMSRQRIRTSVLESSTEKCPHCGGTGHVRSVSSVALQILRMVEESMLRGATHNLIVRTRSDIAIYVLNHKRAHLRDLEQRFRITITISADATITGQTPFVIERGEQIHSIEQARAIAAAQPPAVPVIEPEDEEEEPVEDFEGEEIDESEAEDGEQPAVAEGEEREHAEPGEGGRRRRRRRRRGRRGEGRDEAAAPMAAAEHAVAHEDHDGEPDEGEELESAPGEFAGERREEHAGDGEPRRRRRRGRRGGRRNRRGREGEPAFGHDTDHDTDHETDHETEHEIGPEAREEQDYGDHLPVEPEVAEAIADFDGPPLAHEHAAHEHAVHGGEREQPEGAAPTAHAPETREPTEPASGEPAPAEAPRRRSTVREPVFFSPEGGMPQYTPPQPPAPEPRPERSEEAPAEQQSSQDEANKPRRTGWWAKRILGGG
jgi:ribonuclease E